MHQEAQDHLRSIAPEHNILRMLKVTRSEIGLHSPFLADLLSPYGSHGQGVLFLQEFLRMLAQCAPYPGAPDYRPQLVSIVEQMSERPLPYEWSVGRERQKIDISIRNQWLAGGLIIFIENKIDAGEQPNQLTRYRELLDSLSSYKLRVLVYLTPGVGPTSGQPHVHITYDDHIRDWLTACSDAVIAHHVKYNIAQYIDALDEFSQD